MLRLVESPCKHSRAEALRGSPTGNGARPAASFSITVLAHAGPKRRMVSLGSIRTSISSADVPGVARPMSRSGSREAAPEPCEGHCHEPMLVPLDNHEFHRFEKSFLALNRVDAEIRERGLDTTRALS
jgi:hypothetical protein